MASENEQLPSQGAHTEMEDARPSHRRFRRAHAALAFGALLLLTLLLGWFARERIADDLIARELGKLGLPATYEVLAIGPRRQVLGNIVIGDPARPDLTIERAEVDVKARFGLPAIGQITLVRPRLYGSYHAGKLSLGSLDKLLFEQDRTGEPFRLPDLELALVDGRGLLETDYGPLGVKLEGRGALRGGFSGVVAAVAPEARAQGCLVRNASLYGRLAVTGEKPRFTGPLRIGALACDGDGVRLGGTAMQVDVTLDRALDGAQGAIGVDIGPLALANADISATRGSARFTWRRKALTARYDLAANALATGQLAARSLALEGVLRTGGEFTRFEAEGSVQGEGLEPTSQLDAALDSASRSTAGSFAAPLLAQLRAALRKEGANSSLAAEYLLRRTDGTTSLVIAQARLTGTSGAPLLALSRLRIEAPVSGAARVAGHFRTGGPGMPAIVGRIEPGAGEGIVMHLAMADYRAGAARLAVPRLSLSRTREGEIEFSGAARLSGAVPGGEARELSLPLSGNWSPGAGLSLWRDCVTIGFEHLRYASLTLDARRLRLCPPRGGAIVRSDAAGLRIAAGAPSLALSGRLGSTIIRIASGPVGFAVPGVLTARTLDVGLGPPATESRFRIGGLDARIDRDIAGRFTGSEIRLAAVPLDLVETRGAWRYADGRLTITDASFDLLDRNAEARFRPLAAREGRLTLANNLITADATLHEPASQREVVRTHIVHDLATGRGKADLAVRALIFDRDLQPAAITPLALGVIANAEGTVVGTGRIDWNESEVTSSGSFTTDSLDFAAAFGPVKGVSGTIHFTDLLSLVTAPDQQLRIASINPGIEATGGVLTYELQPNYVIVMKEGHWPFLDGTLRLEPARFRIGAEEAWHLTLTIDGLNAARLIERMELGNVAATGTFDGTLPLVFSHSGGHIEGGRLRSRPPGGNVSYVGALTYEDLSPMANFAFEALKSLNYREMTIDMNGAIAGEIVTQARFHGVTQGEGTSRNFITDRIGRLPIQFNVNLRAPFFQLISSFRSLYDPAYIRDPRELGLIAPDGTPIADPKGDAAPDPGVNAPATSPSSPIQPPASETMP